MLPLSARVRRYALATTVAALAGAGSAVAVAGADPIDGGPADDTTVTTTTTAPSTTWQPPAPTDEEPPFVTTTTDEEPPPTTDEEPPPDADQRDVAVSSEPTQSAGDLRSAGLPVLAAGGTLQGQSGPGAAETEDGPPFGAGSLLMSTQAGGLLRVGWDTGFAQASVVAFLQRPCLFARGSVCEEGELSYSTYAPGSGRPAALPKLVLKVVRRDENVEYWAYDPLDEVTQEAVAGEWQAWDTRAFDFGRADGGWRRYDGDGEPIPWGEELPDAINLLMVLFRLEYGSESGRYTEARFGTFTDGTPLQIVLGDVGKAIRGESTVAGGAPAATAAIDGVRSFIPDPDEIAPPARAASGTARALAVPRSSGGAARRVLNLEARTPDPTTPASPSNPGSPAGPGTPASGVGTPPLTTAATGPPARQTPRRKRKARPRTCASRRSFTIRLRRTAGGRLTGLRATVNGRRTAVRRRADGRYVVRVDVRGREGRSRFVVRLRATTARGRRLSATRVYRPCRPVPLDAVNGATALSLRIDPAG